MTSRFKSYSLLLLMAALLFGASRVQVSMNHDRDALGLTRVEALTDAPPVLAFTTVALGGFRGLISNMLWIRMSELQDQDKFFEMAQLADWITDLEPHFGSVWIFQAWNMAYNISVKFKDYPDRWRWVQRGIELLRDQGLKYNPDNVLMYRELAWFFQHKLGANLDDANMYYKQHWANDMAQVFGKKTPNLDELIHPVTPDQKRRAQLLRDTYKMDPAFMKKVNEEYGPLEWRLPEASAIYWAAKGLEAAKKNPTKIKKSDLITLRRVIYQSMLLSFQRGRLVANPFTKTFDFAPNLDIIPKVNDAYEQAMRDDKANRENIATAQRNFLRDAVYFLYEDNRIAEAAKWYRYLGEKYPDKPILDFDPNSLPGTLTLDQYAVACVQEDVNETSRDRVRASIHGLLKTSYENLVLGDDGRAAGFRLLAEKVWKTYQDQIPKSRMAAIGLPSMAEMDQDVRSQLLNPTNGLPPEARAVLRTKLRLPAETAPPASPQKSTQAAS